MALASGGSRWGSLGSNEPPFLLIHSTDRLVYYWTLMISDGLLVQFSPCIIFSVHFNVEFYSLVKHACSEAIGSIF